MHDARIAQLHIEEQEQGINTTCEILQILNNYN